MKVCLVGNGCSEKWHCLQQPQNSSAFIDACDIVVRLNCCPHYYRGWTGWRTDILLLRSAADPGYGVAMAGQYDLTIPDAATRQAGKVLVYQSDDSDTVEAAADPYCARYRWKREQVELISYRYEALTRAACGASSFYAMITLGTIAVYLALERYPAAELFLAGYYWHGVQTQTAQWTHDWIAERDWLRELEYQRRVIFLP